MTNPHDGVEDRMARDMKLSGWDDHDARMCIRSGEIVDCPGCGVAVLKEDGCEDCGLTIC